jgi:GTP cyclohydrolase I/GTP cyclohydrolase-4
VQGSDPAIRLSLSRAGVTNVEKVIRIGPQLYHARLDCFVELGPQQRGAHMSRFEEVVNDVLGEVVLGDGGFKAEDLARRIAVAVRERQDALRAEVTIAARYPEQKGATQEIYTLLGAAVASARGARRVVGVAASRARRGQGTLQLGLPEACRADVDAAELLAIVEGSMSSHPRSVARCVRAALAATVARFGELGDDALVSSRQERHGVLAERAGLFGELRRELGAGGPVAHFTTLREWLSAAGSDRRPGS